MVTDARRREVYLSVYRADGARAAGPLVAAPAAVPALLAEQHLLPSYLTGAGAALLDPVRDDRFAPERARRAADVASASGWSNGRPKRC